MQKESIETILLKDDYGYKTNFTDYWCCAWTLVPVVGVQGKYLVVDCGYVDAVRALRALLPFGIVCRLRYARLLYPCWIVWLGGLALGT